MFDFYLAILVVLTIGAVYGMLFWYSVIKDDYQYGYSRKGAIAQAVWWRRLLWIFPVALVLWPLVMVIGVPATAAYFLVKGYKHVTKIASTDL